MSPLRFHEFPDPGFADRRIPDQVVVNVAGQGRPEDERRMKERAFKAPEAALPDRLITPDHEAPFCLEPEVDACDIVANHLDLANVADAEAKVVGHPDVGDAQRIEAHDPGRYGVDGHRIARSEEDILDAWRHGPRTSPVPADGPVHDTKKTRVDFLLHREEIHEDFMDVFVRIMADFLQQAAERVLDSPRGRGMAMRLDRRQMEDILSDVHGRDLDPFGKDLVELEERTLEPVSYTHLRAHE